MSIKKAQVSRKLVINSPQVLWDVLKFRTELWSTNQSLKDFIFLFDKFNYDCWCDREKNKIILLEQYDFIRNDIQLIEYLRTSMNCSELIFTEEVNF